VSPESGDDAVVSVSDCPLELSIRVIWSSLGSILNIHPQIVEQPLAEHCNNKTNAFKLVRFTFSLRIEHAQERMDANT
jgi:hypothetical protein